MHTTQERITRLASGVAVIKVGAATEVDDREEASHRRCSRSSQIRSEEGILPVGVKV